MPPQNNTRPAEGSPATATQRPEWGKMVIEGIKQFVGFLVVPLAMVVVLVREVIRTFRSALGVNAAKLEQLQGKVVLITGSSSGIGEGVAEHFYRAGCKVILAARRKQELERVRDSLLGITVPDKRTYTPQVLELDLSEDSPLIGSRGQAAIDIFGRVDILVNNAGVLTVGYVLDTVMEVDKHAMAVNYLGTLALTKVLGNHMRARKQGHIVFVSSMLGKFTVPNCVAYSASKRALQALADGLRMEVTKEGVNVTIISPGFVKTPICENAMSSSGDKWGHVSEDVEEGYSVQYFTPRIFQAIVNEDADVEIAQLLPRAAVYGRSVTPTLFFAWFSFYRKLFEKPQ